MYFSAFASDRPRIAAERLRIVRRAGRRTLAQWVSCRRAAAVACFGSWRVSCASRRHRGAPYVLVQNRAAARDSAVMPRDCALSTPRRRHGRAVVEGPPSMDYRKCERAKRGSRSRRGLLRDSHERAKAARHGKVASRRS
jgi:hypothetical protein